jgi:hypothetical protein
MLKLHQLKEILKGNSSNRLMTYRDVYADAVIGLSLLIIHRKCSVDIGYQRRKYHISNKKGSL